MSEQLQLRRGVASAIVNFTGAQGEVVVDTTNNRLIVNDGATAGGFAAARLDEVFTIVEQSAISASTTISTPGFYRVTAIGVTVTLPGSWTFKRPVVIKEWTGSASPNLAVVGLIDGVTATVALGPKASATFFWSPSTSSWIQT